MTDDAQARKEQIAGLYCRTAATYGKVGPDVFTPFGRWLVECVHLSPGERVLDVATGRGAVLFPAAEQVGPAGYVTGIDLAEQMVRETAAELRQRGLTNIAVQQMDAEQLDFPNSSFDAVLCSCAFNFFPRAEQAVAEIHRVLRPGGRVGICVPFGADERWLWYTQLVFAYHQTYHLSMDWVPRVFDLAAVTSLLSRAGFEALSSASWDHEFVYASEQEWWDAQWTDAARSPLENMPPEVLDRFKAEVFQRMASLNQLGGLHYRRKAGSVVGARPLVDMEQR
jgi:ubiquinone/menaquinone biosynthesis C-methylase UbiE